MKTRVLIADDEATICRLLKAELDAAGFQTTLAQDGRTALELYRSGSFDVVVLDINMPEMSGLQVLKQIKQDNRSLVFMMTAYGSIDGAVAAMKMQADDYITKPFDPQELVEKIQQTLQVRQKVSRLGRGDGSGPQTLLGKSPAMEQIRSTVEKIKDRNTTVLITGESGTGKGVVAKYIHAVSNRSELPFMHIDCASLPHNLIESELFGHERGSFTNAVAQKKGKLELAGRGSAFLDEISTMPLELQSKFLVVLQEKYFERLGGSQRLPLNARIIAATNEELEQAVENGTFRADLFYRLNIVRIECPPLRARREDIPDMARHFIAAHVQKTGVEIEEVDEDVFEALSDYGWPGNVRELENTLESAVVLSDGHRLRLSNFPRKITARTSGGPAPLGAEASLSLENQEIITILAALDKHNGHREKTARELGISRRALQYKLAKYHITK